MDEQTRATFILAAATLAAAKMQAPGRSHNDQSAVQQMIDVLHEMESRGVIPPDVDKADPGNRDPTPMNFGG